MRHIDGRPRPDLTQAPTEVVQGPWRHLVWDERGRVSRAFYTWCVLDRLRGGLRRRDVFVPGSLDWGDPRSQLLQGAAWAVARPHVCRALELPDQPAVALEWLGSALTEAFSEAARALRDADLAWITARRGLDTIAIGYRFDLPPPVAAGERRAIRLANSSHAPPAAAR